MGGYPFWQFQLPVAGADEVIWGEKVVDRCGVVLRSASEALPVEGIVLPQGISSRVQLLRCGGRREQVVGFTQGWDVSGG